MLRKRTLERGLKEDVIAVPRLTSFPEEGKEFGSPSLHIASSGIAHSKSFPHSGNTDCGNEHQVAPLK